MGEAFARPHFRNVRAVRRRNAAEKKTKKTAVVLASITFIFCVYFFVIYFVFLLRWGGEIKHPQQQAVANAVGPLGRFSNRVRCGWFLWVSVISRRRID